MKLPKNRLMVAAALTVAAGFVLSGCASGGSGASTSASGGPIVIGSTLPLTGSLQAFGTSLQTGYRKAVDEVNAAGGLDVGGSKRQVTLDIQDNASDADKASSQARNLVLSDGAVALLGPATPQLTIPVSIAADQAQVPLISTITPLEAWKGGSSDGWKYAWDVFFDEDQMTDTQYQTADLVSTNKKVALFTDQEEDGVVMGGLWSSKASEFGYDIAYQAQFPVGNANFSSQVAEAKASGAEVVIAQVIPPDGIALLKEMKAQSYVPKLVFLEKAGNTGGYPKLSDGLAEGTLAANWFAKGMGLPDEDSFISEYASQLGGVNSDLGTVVYGYSIAKMLLDAISSAGSTDPDAINDAIAKISGDYPLGSVAFGDDHTSATVAVQTQWVGEDQVLVLDTQGKAANPIVTPTAGLQ